jgi:hypothetical protein
MSIGEIDNTKCSMDITWEKIVIKKNNNLQLWGFFKIEGEKYGSPCFLSK